MADPRLRVEGASAFRSDRLVLDAIGFDLQAGGAMLVLGPNGAGKSTLLRALAGLKRLDAGWITLDGAVEFTGLVAYLGHQDGLKPGLTARENLGLAARISGLDTDVGLNSLGISALADLPARILSAGQKRRLALARLVVSGAPLWLLDEPTLGVDAASVERFGLVLARHRAAGGMVVAATHLPLPLPDAAELHLSPAPG